jgi:hypothetical protein
MIQGQGQGRCEILIPSLPNDSWYVHHIPNSVFT